MTGALEARDAGVLRPATDADALAVAEVLITARRAFMPYAPMAHDAADVRGWVREVLVPAGGVTVACVADTVAGVLAMSESDGVAWVDQLYVAPGFTGRGIGARLLGHAMVSCRRPLRLHSFQANLGARRFYERHGFRVIGFTDGQSNEERCPDVLFECA